MWKDKLVILYSFLSRRNGDDTDETEFENLIKKKRYPSVRITRYLAKNYNTDKMNPFAELSFSLHPKGYLLFSYRVYRFPI